MTGTGFALTGADADNYTLGAVAPTTADITARGLTGAFTAAGKVYDGTTTVTLSDNRVGGDALVWTPVTGR